MQAKVEPIVDRANSPSYYRGNPQKEYSFKSVYGESYEDWLQHAELLKSILEKPGSEKFVKTQQIRRTIRPRKRNMKFFSSEWST